MKQFSTVFLEKVVNYLPSTRDLKPFIEFSHHPGWVKITAVSRWKFSSRMRSTGNIELIITSLVNTKLCICINLASMATPWAYVMYVSKIQHGGCVYMGETLAVENLSKIGQIVPVFDENTLLWWTSTSTPYEID